MSQSRRNAPTAPPLTTRKANKEAHPGLPDAAKPRKRQTEIQAEKDAKTQASCTTAAAKQAKVKHLAQIEEALVAEAESPQKSLRSLPVTNCRTDNAPSGEKSSGKKLALHEGSLDGNDSPVEEGSAKRGPRRSDVSDVSKDQDEDEDDDVANIRPRLRISKGGRQPTRVSFMEVDEAEAVADDDNEGVIVRPKKKKGRVDVDAVRQGLTRSTPSKSVLQKRSAPDTCATPSKSNSNAPPSKRLRPIGGLNSHWVPSSGKSAAQPAPPPLSSPPPDPFDEGSDGGRFNESAPSNPVALHVNMPTPRPRGHTKRQTPAKHSDGDFDAHHSLDANAMEDVGDFADSAAVTTSTVPPRLSRPIASNTRIQKAPVHQDANALTQVSAPTVAKLGLKSCQSVTKTARRSRRKPRWTTEHLDEAVCPTFNGAFMSKVREHAGTLQPFSLPSVEAIQTLFDEMYPEVSIVVVKGQVLYDLTLQRLNEWKSMISSEALSNVKAYLEIDEADDVDEAEGRWCFESAAKYVEWVLHSEDGKNAPMYWARWNDGVGKETLSAHLAVIPPDSKEHLSGALILSLLAVERALKVSRSGTLVVPHRLQGFFSAENWGDQTVRTSDGHIKMNRKASKFFTAVDALSADAWSRILTGAYQWLGASCQVEDEVIEESDDDDSFMMSSDPPISDSDDA
ncbi:hypothetical protein OF83DRAFT_1086519 [Amylostereum chailletii]|nr:hypothetical protein OF83DRAFT_1086519 [Amylostereum chailletii]